MATEPAGGDDETSIPELSDAWRSARDKERLADKTKAGYKYAHQRFIAFLDEYDLNARDLSKGTGLTIPLETLDEDEDGEIKNGASVHDGRDYLDYFVLWLRDDEAYADSTVKTTYFSLKAFLDHLYDEGFIAVDSTDEFGLNRYVSYTKTEQSDKLGKLKQKAVDEEEHELLRENVPAPSFRNALITDILWECGLRREEISLLTKDCFEMEETEDEDGETRYTITGRSIEVPPVKWKRSEEKPDSHIVFFSESLKTNITIWMNVKRKTYTDYDQYDAMFIQDHGPNKGPISDNRVNKIVNDAAENAGIQEPLYPDQAGNTRSRITAHSYRHGFAFKSIENGMDIYALKEVMNHHSVSVTEQYLDAKKEYIKKQMDKARLQMTGSL